MIQYESIDDYISKQPAEQQLILQKIRETIRASAPKAIEKISYMMPTFWQDENLVHFAVFKKHFGFFPGGEVTTHFAECLKQYKTSKGTIQFPINQPINYSLIADIVKWRVAQVEKKIKQK